MAAAAAPQAHRAASWATCRSRSRPGAFVGILGPNGSGKTTLVKLLGGLLAPTAGDVLLDGQPVARWSRRALAQRIAMVPQELHPAFDYTVLEMTLMGRFPHLGPFAVEGPADIEIARQALEATGALTLEDRSFSTLGLAPGSVRYLLSASSGCSGWRRSWAARSAGSDTRRWWTRAARRFRTGVRARRRWWGRRTSPRGRTESPRRNCSSPGR